MSIKVGVVIPNHNYEKWVANSINSIVNDPYDNKFLVVVDDGSTDNSWDIIRKELRLEHKQGKMVGNLNGIPTAGFRYDKAGGPSRARNTGIKLLWDSVDLFCFLDSDDEYRPGKIAQSVNKFLFSPNVGAVYSDYDTYNDKTGLLYREYKEPFSRQRLMQECIINNNSMVSKQALDMVGGYDEEMRTCEDYDLWMRVSERFIITHIPEALVMIRVGNHNSTSTVANEVWQKNWHRVMMKAQERAKNGK